MEWEDKGNKMAHQVYSTILNFLFFKVWRIEKFKKVEVPLKNHGTFFEGDCYVILYTYKPKGREQHIIYFWQVVILAFSTLFCNCLLK